MISSREVFLLRFSTRVLPFGVFVWCCCFLVVFVSLVEVCRFDQGVEDHCRTFGWPALLVVRCSRGVLNLLNFLDT